MKIFTRLAVGVAALWLAGTLNLTAQETHSAAKVIVVQKVAQENGNVNVTKKEINETELATYLENLKSIDGKNVEIHLTTKEGESIRISPDEDGTLLYVREANGKAVGLTKISEGKHINSGHKITAHAKEKRMERNYNFNYNYSNNIFSYFIN